MLIQPPGNWVKSREGVGPIAACDLGPDEFATFERDGFVIWKERKQEATLHGQICAITAEDSPEILAAVEAMPVDVKNVVLAFRADYAKALNNFKESYAAMFEWAYEAVNQLSMLKAYLEAEKMRGELGISHEQASGVSK